MFERIAPGTYALAAELPAGLKHRGRGRPPMDLVRAPSLSPRAHPTATACRHPRAPSSPLTVPPSDRPTVQWVLRRRWLSSSAPQQSYWDNCVLGSVSHAQPTCAACSRMPSHSTCHTEQGEPA